VFLAGVLGYKDPNDTAFGAITRANVRWFERGVLNGKVVYEPWIRMRGQPTSLRRPWCAGVRA
jgi:hypothetical protein